nr:Scr1 family TA system antitoxin-like transcriptional regulator [Streptomyces sp. YIM 98790]
MCWSPQRTCAVASLRCPGTRHAGGSLVLLDLEAGGVVALVESFRTGQAMESPREVVEYQELYEAAQVKALPVHESSAAIARYMKDYEDAED